MKFLLLIIWMVFMHIVDDYYLQGILASLKQRKWWNEHAPDEMYKNDYIIALAMHGISWAVMITFPIFAMDGFNTTWFIVISVVVNAIAHSLIDNAKANLKKLNLIQDQVLHMYQILITIGLYAAGGK